MDNLQNTPKIHSYPLHFPYYIKKYHLYKHFLHKGLSNELRASKEVKKSIEELLKDQILLSKPTHYGLEISLNPQKIKEIEALMS